MIKISIPVRVKENSPLLLRLLARSHCLDHWRCWVYLTGACTPVWMECLMLAMEVEIYLQFFSWWKQYHWSLLIYYKAVSGKRYHTLFSPKLIAQYINDCTAILSALSHCDLKCKLFLLGKRTGTPKLSNIIKDKLQLW